MSKRSVSTLVLLVGGICCVFGTAQAGEKATKTDVEGWFENGQTVVFGDVWLSGPIIHYRDFLYHWDQVATDPRLEGDIFNEFNANLDMRTPFADGRMWGGIWLEQDGVRVWEGTWNGEYLNDIQLGNGVLHGVGIYEGLKVKMSFEQRPGYLIMDFEAVILDPGGS